MSPLNLLKTSMPSIFHKIRHFRREEARQRERPTPGKPYYLDIYVRIIFHMHIRTSSFSSMASRGMVYQNMRLTIKLHQIKFHTHQSITINLRFSMHEFCSPTLWLNPIQGALACSYTRVRVLYWLGGSTAPFRSHGTNVEWYVGLKTSADLFCLLPYKY